MYKRQGQKHKPWKRLNQAIINAKMKDDEESTEAQQYYSDLDGLLVGL